MLKAQEIRDKIIQKTELFKSVRAYKDDMRLSATETEQVFKNMGIVMPQKKLV